MKNSIYLQYAVNKKPSLMQLLSEGCTFMK